MKTKNNARKVIVLMVLGVLLTSSFGFCDREDVPRLMNIGISSIVK